MKKEMDAIEFLEKYLIQKKQEETKWCPQHGYPEPCAKCNGMALKAWPEIMRWVSAFASCAIEGNLSAKRMIDMWNSGGQEQFILELYRDWVEG